MNEFYKQIKGKHDYFICIAYVFAGTDELARKFHLKDKALLTHSRL